MTEIYEHLQDQESRDLFEARISYALNKNQSEYMDTVRELYDDWKFSYELEERISEIKPKGLIIFGCGHAGRTIGRMLKYWEYEVSFFCDNYKAGETFEGRKVLSVDEVKNEYSDYLVIISSYEFAEEMRKQLVENGFLNENIFLPASSRILAWGRGNQYFDVFSPQADEVYVDAGTFDGKTILDFCEWTNGTYEKIYAFEPMSDMCAIIEKKAQENHIHNIEIFNCATWDKREKIYFTEDGQSTCMDEKGKTEVQGIDIDAIVKDDKVTFIKMDVEGSELRALKGAKNTIIRNHPRLAICIYHKPMDVIELASYILEIVPEYKFYIRHYSSHMWETVLYAVI